MIEFLKVILTPHIIWGGVLIFFAYRFKNGFSLLLTAITDRIKNVQGYKKTKDGHELTFQESQTDKSNNILPNVSDTPPEASPEKSEGFMWDEDKTDDTETLKKLVKIERSDRYLWEYRYLNYFLVRHSQHIIDWFASNDSPQTFGSYNNYWEKNILDKKEREAVISVLGDFFLIQSVQGDKLQITPKGKEYQAWRGPLPPLLETATKTE